MDPDDSPARAQRQGTRTVRFDLQPVSATAMPVTRYQSFDKEPQYGWLMGQAEASSTSSDEDDEDDDDYGYDNDDDDDGDEPAADGDEEMEPADGDEMERADDGRQQEQPNDQGQRHVMPRVDSDDELTGNSSSLAHGTLRGTPVPVVPAVSAVRHAMLHEAFGERTRRMDFRDGDLVEADSDDSDDDDGGGMGLDAYEPALASGDASMADGSSGEGGFLAGRRGESGFLAGSDMEQDREGEGYYGYGGEVGFDAVSLGLKEINNLAHFSASSHKPGNSVSDLLIDDLDHFWQSDGPQPHLVTIHFLRRVEIRALRFYVDFNIDESYTPSRVSLSAGTGHHDLIEFATLELHQPVGWQDISLKGIGGGPDGNALSCWIVQLRILENHQNGKDTHLRGIKLYTVDENAEVDLPTPRGQAQVGRPGRLGRPGRPGRPGRLFVPQQDDISPILDPSNEYLLDQLLAQSPERAAAQAERSGGTSAFREMEIR